jgi:hypothetical protein
MGAVGFVAPFSTAPSEVTTPWPHDGPVSVSLSRYTPARPPSAAATPLRWSYGSLDVRGVPPGIVVRPQGVDGALRFADGHVERFRNQLGGRTYTVVGRSASDPEVAAAAEHALGSKVFHDRNDRTWGRRFAVLDTQAAGVKARAGLSGRYEATVSLIAYRLRTAAQIPARAGERAGVASRDLTIVARHLEPDSYSLDVRLTRPALLWRRAGELEFLLVNRARGEAMPGQLGQASFGAFRSRLSPFYLLSSLSKLSFSRTLPDGRSRLDDTWFDGAELAVLAIEEEGAFTRRVALDYSVPR